MAAEQAAEQERQRVAAEEKREELARQKAAEVARIQAAKEAARLKEEEHQRIVAQQKADADAKKAEQARLQAEAREAAQAAALKAAEEKAAAQKALVEQQKTLARIGTAAQQLAVQLKLEQQLQAKAARTMAAVTSAPAAPFSSASNKVDSATLQRMSTDPKQLPAVRNLASVLLASEYKSSAKDATTATGSSEIGRASVTGGTVPLPSTVSGDYILQSVLNDPNRSTAARKIAAIGLGVDPNSVVLRISESPNTVATAVSTTQGGSTSSGPPSAQTSAQTLKLNADLKTSITTLSPGAPRPIILAPKPNMSIAFAPKAQSTPAQTQSYSPFDNGIKNGQMPAASGGCLATSWKQTVSGQVPLPSIGAATKTVATDAFWSAAGAVKVSPLIDQMNEALGDANTAAGVVVPLATGNQTMAAANGVTAATVYTEQKFGGPVIGQVAGGLTQVGSDLGTMYASPILGNALYNCLPNVFTPK